MLVKKKKSYTRTTLTHKWLRKYPDLRTDFVPTASEQLWVADITYIRTVQGFEYLSLITDAYSRKIVGWCCYPTLQTKGCIIALKMALEQCKYPTSQLIHHSDRGVQYCSEAYTSILLEHNCQVSVTQNGSPYENPVAECMNSILKGEQGLDQTFKKRTLARSETKKQIHIYNHVRIHGSIDYMTPEQAYDLNGEIAKRWKSKPKMQQVS